ncbi:hypothetical protein RF55_18601 [Lasius niger]|uniref:Reverse transcriptase domain-containing protein n=1 Tax=Lasius niger TaxID=67767 RepID=A0A0J7K135_LASNI|nr:hypothetical protein RF55_18601 [Lasius niger]
MELIKCVENNMSKLPRNICLNIRNRDFIRDNPDVIFTRADKGNVTIALNKIDYLEKMNVLLGDTNTYTTINKDLTKKLRKKREFIDEKTYKKLNCTDGVLPRAYGLPKIHKPGCLLRTFGTPMGSPLSPVIADITLQDLETRAVEILPIKLPFYCRYVDDIALAIPSSLFNTVLQTFNSFHPRLQFTMEKGTDGSLNFLDITI